MSDQFDSAETVEQSLRRIAAEQVAAALHQARDRPGGEGEAVHRCRKTCKAMRSLLRLVRPSLPEAKPTNRALREAARGLSANRDRLVLYQTAEKLRSGLRGAARRACEPAVAELERAWREPQEATDDAARLDAFAEAMQRIGERVEAWSLQAEGYEAIAGGLSREYQRGRRAMRHALAQGEGEAYHDWRKRAKDLDHHLRLLTPLWPSVLRPTRKQASKLGDALGEHHDLVVLAETLRAEPDRYGGASATAPLRRAAKREMRRRETRAHALGQRLYAESPARFVERMGMYWQQWRLEATDHRRGSGAPPGSRG